MPIDLKNKDSVGLIQKAIETLTDTFKEESKVSNRIAKELGLEFWGIKDINDWQDMPKARRQYLAYPIAEYAVWTFIPLICHWDYYKNEADENKATKGDGCLGIRFSPVESLIREYPSPGFDDELIFKQNQESSIIIEVYKITKDLQPGESMADNWCDDEELATHTENEWVKIADHLYGLWKKYDYNEFFANQEKIIDFLKPLLTRDFEVPKTN